jgi:flagellum-specific peptidoglycan hydrolase FlgJ
MNSKLLDKELSLLGVSGRWSVETISQEEVVSVQSLWMRKMLVIASCVALLATMGMYTGAGNAQPDDRFETLRYVLDVQALPHVPAAMQAPAAQPPRHTPDPPKQVPPASIRLEQAAYEQHVQAAKAMQAQATGAPAVILSYEVTAYYLNVREQPSSDSAILDVAEKGERLRVSNATDNGWYKLQDGGYVHGDYLKPSEGVHTWNVNGVSAAVRTAVPKLNQEVAIASAAPVPAVRKTIPGEPMKPSSTVEVDSGLTEAHIADIFEGTALEGHDLEQAILDVEETYGINAYFTIAVMKLESGNGKSKLAKEKNNLFGLNAVGNSTKKAFAFETKADSVYKFGQLISKSYVGKGYTTIEKVARKYCPANPKWASLVKRIMNGDYKKL